MAAIQVGTLMVKQDVALHKVHHWACITPYEAMSTVCHWAMNKKH